MILQASSYWAVHMLYLLCIAIWQIALKFSSLKWQTLITSVSVSQKSDCSSVWASDSEGSGEEGRGREKQHGSSSVSVTCATFISSGFESLGSTHKWKADVTEHGYQKMGSVIWRLPTSFRKRTVQSSYTGEVIVSRVECPGSQYAPCFMRCKNSLWKSTSWIL